MLAIENAEIGGTIIALSVPGLKPLFGSLFANLTGSDSKSQSKSSPLSYPLHMIGGRSHLSSKKSAIVASETTIKANGRSLNDSDDNLLGGHSIHVRQELNIETKNNSNAMIESHPKDW